MKRIPEIYVIHPPSIHAASSEPMDVSGLFSAIVGGDNKRPTPLTRAAFEVAAVAFDLLGRVP